MLKFLSTSRLYAVNRLHRTQLNAFCHKCFLRSSFENTNGYNPLLSTRYIGLFSVNMVPIKLEEPTLEKKGLFRSSLDNMKWIFSERPKRAEESLLLYEAGADHIEYEKIFQKCCLPDTLFSWFLIVELHVWMCQTRLMKEGKTGYFMRNEVVRGMWLDVETRVKILAEMASSQRRSVMSTLEAHFHGAMFAYDEGLMSEDKVLAAALWRVFYSYDCNDPERLEMMVAYVRRQVDHLESLSMEKLQKAELNWLPFDKVTLLIR